MRIEAVQPQDAAQVEAFMEHVVLASVDATPAEKGAFMENIRANLARWLREPDAVLHLQAVVDGALVGVVMVKDFWNLCHLFVAPGQQGRGIGRALVEAAIAGCRDRSPRQALRLNAARNAVAFYRRLGFTPVAGAPVRLGVAPMELRFEMDRVGRDTGAG